MGSVLTEITGIPFRMAAVLRAVPEMARIVGKLETEAARGEMAAFSVGLMEQIDAWGQAAPR